MPGLDDFSPKALAMVARAEGELTAGGVFARMEAVALLNEKRVLDAMREYRVEPRHFSGTTGYGYDDVGRDTLDKIFARCMGAEAALVRPQIVNGTHALALALYGTLRPGDTMVAVTGKPYDTLEQVIGISGPKGQGSLMEYGVRYRQLELNGEGKVDLPALETALAGHPAMIYMQRSRGYSLRAALSLADIAQVAQLRDRVSPGTVLMVDNCYGEFVETGEPTEVGAQLMAGSLIKNPGGGLADTGGYLAGRADLVERAAFRLTTPGVGGEVGSYASGYRNLYEGLFLAPHTVLQSVKTAALLAHTLGQMGYVTSPDAFAPRYDIIQTVRLESPEALCTFCRAIQAAAPVDAHVVPEPWPMPGYQDEIIMAAGAFVQGSSIELSADGPLRPPYMAYFQGGLTYEHGKLAVLGALTALLADR